MNEELAYGPSKMDRMDKLEYLLETCNPEFIKDCTFLTDLVASMGEDEFTECYNYICRMYEIPRSYEELNKKMGIVAWSSNQSTLYWSYEK